MKIPPFLFALLFGLAACAPVTATPTSTATLEASATQLSTATMTPVPSPTDTPTPENTPTPTFSFGGSTKPNTIVGGIESLSEDIHFMPPTEWTKPLTSEQQDPHPYVKSGDLGESQVKLSGGGFSGSEILPGSVMSFEYYGVDFRGIVLAEDINPNTKVKRYVAGFSFVNPETNKMYLLNMVLIDIHEGYNVGVPISENGDFFMSMVIGQ